MVSHKKRAISSVSLQKLKIEAHTNIVQKETIFDNKLLKIYKSCMSLIEEVARYTEEKGRRELKQLTKEVALLYQKEAAHMSTRLMQMAAWLLLWRAEKDKDMAPELIAFEKTKISFMAPLQSADQALWQKLPPDFQNLIAKSMSLEENLRFIEQAMRKSASCNLAEQSAIVEQQDRLKLAFK